MWLPGVANCSSYTVPTRWLSQAGLAYLHGNYVHQGTVCRAFLITLYGTWNELDGCVERCEYINGHVHEVTIRFVGQLDPGLYCAEAVACRVLLAEDDRLTARMISAWLKQLNATVQHVEDGREAVAVASQSHFDLVLMDLDLPIMDGFRATRAVRNAGFCGRIAAISSLATAHVQRMALQSGCDMFLAKPFAREQLAELLVSLREEPIYSTLPYAESVSDLISDFVRQFPQEAKALQEAVERGDSKSIGVLARALKTQGSTYGFDCVTEVATQIETTLLTSGLSENLFRTVQELRRIGVRMRSPVRSSFTD